MQLGMIGLGRMGANMVRRLMKNGHECVVFDTNEAAIEELEKEGAIGARTLEEFASKLTLPRAAWVMVPAAITDKVITELTSFMDEGDIVIDGGNSYFRDDRRRAKELEPRGIHYIDCGTSGGVWGMERGYCLMIGGQKAPVEHLDPIFATIAPGEGDIEKTPGRPEGKGTAQKGYLHCGPAGAGHFVKMVHNGIEYGIMAAYAEGLDILNNADCDTKSQEVDAETAPSMHGDLDYSLDLGEISEVWRRGSVIASWLLDLTANSFVDDAKLEKFSGRVSDSGEGRWTIEAAIESGTPAPVLTSALYERFRSREEHAFADKVCSAMRFQFGGHLEKKA
ncbi:phosphogluconate dehydrogenase (NAD(+)-dependent, decarboxylating) [Cerasicoccus arenae]|uniref:6-phosphogluconate dehydrogenase n=1 Tax=Cerasicoccus arenae TaxID=424488 RepID=A0A8J3GD85_9BACT|nr:decarboxylating 6-phosphogluconate dehydrogenase [Cerasicoccus arenae]MBK1859343.1 decarboxylating 6-phosphogluconate dehydrogenase [Cerasicoccus arenae]GHB93826.1 6-phosphogluconate dehydrogenase [Cerasicoccus arenae]